MTSKYYSSAEKDFVRASFDTPLIEYMRGKKGSALNYFGLPGEQAPDVFAWRKSLHAVSAVEKSPQSLSRIERFFGTRLPELRLDLHFGDIDTVIMNDRGSARSIGNQPHRPKVSKAYVGEVPEWRWDFDVVNLDYFGAFLPLAIKGAARRRADALKALFEKTRQDAWQRWLLLITTNAHFAGKDDEKMMKEYLRGSRADCSSETKALIDFVLDGTHDEGIEPALLIHGSAAALLAIAASNAGAIAYPRGTVIYAGAKNHKMIHMAFEFEPATTAISAPLSREALLRCPFLTPAGEDSLQFQLLSVQLPGVASEVIRTCLSFMDENEVTRLAQ